MQNIKKYLPALFVIMSAAVSLLFFLMIFYLLWTPGMEVTDGRHDLKKNGIWLQHGWLANDRWFYENMTDRKEYFRSRENMNALAALLRKNNITDVFPHLAPTSVEGKIPLIESDQLIIFLEEFADFRVMPWVGGVVGKQAFPEDIKWRNNFTQSIHKLLLAYPGLKGIHINIEPCPSGNNDFITLLDEVLMVLPDDMILSVVAFPPPTLWHPFSSVHWDEEYYRQVSQMADQLVVMMYDTAIRFEKVYQYVMTNWTQEVLEWSKDSRVLLGLPAYEDDWAWYHDPEVENLKNALRGIHSSLGTVKALPDNYQGIALYSEWEMQNEKWILLRNSFLKE